jgi:hypothetical protein
VCVHTCILYALYVLYLTMCVHTCVKPYLVPLITLGTASNGSNGAGAVDCDSRRAVGPIRTIRGVFMTQLNRLQRLATLSAPNEWSF